VRDYYPANGRRNDGIDMLAAEVRRQRLTNPFRMLGVLKNQSALQIPRTMQPGRQLKMTFKQCAGPLEDLKEMLLLICHLSP
jgi:hypothetical protein